MSNVASPVDGTTRPLSDLEDPVFNSYAVGDGIGIVATASTPVVSVRSPIAGKAIRVMPHAFVIVSDDGKGILVHIGIDTVGLKGEGFTVLCQQGSSVERGQEMVQFNPEFVRSKGLDPTVLVCLMDSKRGDLVFNVAESGSAIRSGDDLFSL